MNRDRLRSLLFDTILILLIFFAPLMVGSVHVKSGSLLTMGVALLFLIHLSAGILSPTPKTERPSEKGMMALYLISFLFLLLTLIQLLPLPSGWVETLSPRAHLFYDSARAFLGTDLPASAGKAKETLSLYPHATRRDLILHLTYLLTFFVVVREVTEKERIRKIILALIAVGFLESLYGLYSYFSRDYYIFGYRVSLHYAASGSFINRNHYVAFLGMIFPLGMGYLLSRGERRGDGGIGGLRRKIRAFFTTDFTPEKGVLTVMVTLMVPGILFSLSRMGVFSFLASLTFMGMVTLLKRKKRSAALLTLLLLGGIGLSLQYGLRPLEERYRSTIDTMEDLRLPVWKRTLRYAGDFLLTGSGPGTYEYVYHMYEGKEGSPSTVLMNHAHNDYLELLAETGLPGLLALLSAGGLLFFILLREWMQRKNPFATGVGLGGMGSLIYMSLHSLTDFNFHIPANGFLLFLVAALTWRGVRVRGFPFPPGIPFPFSTEKNGGSLVPVLRERVAASLLLLLPGFMVYFSVQRWRSESFYPVERSSLWETKRGKIPNESDLPDLRKAMALRPGLLDYRLILGNYYLFGASSEGKANGMERRERALLGREQFAKALALTPLATGAFSGLARTDFMLGDPKRGLSRLDRSVELSGGDYYSRALFGVIVATYFRSIPEEERPLYLTRARWELEESVRRNPILKEDPSVQTSLARIHLLEGDTKGAIRALQSIPQRENEAIPSPHRLLLARLYLHTGQENRALDLYKTMRDRGGPGTGARLLPSLKENTKRYPRMVRLRIYLGRLLLEKGETEQILNLFRGQDPFAGLPAGEAAEGHFLLGETHEKRGEFPEALREYRETLRYAESHEGARKKVLELFRKGIS